MELMEQLKQHCHASHLQVRAGEYAAKIMDHSLTLAQYAQLLYANALFHGYLERAVAAQLTDALKSELSLEKRQKAKYARKELLNMGIVMSADARKDIKNSRYRIQNIEQALGALYVMEGTAIGGAIIRKQLLQMPHLGEPLFYGAYGAALSPLWKSFASCMNAQVLQASLVLAQAEKTFLLYEHALHIAEMRCPLQQLMPSTINAMP